MNNTTLPVEYQLPHPRDISDSPLEQQASLEKRAIRILNELTSRAETALDRLDDAKAKSNNILMSEVDSMISAGQLPLIPGVIKDTVLAAQVLAEKTTAYAEQGLQLIKITVTPTGMNTNITTLVYIDPKVTTIDIVKAHMLNAAEENAEATTQAKQRSFDNAKSDIEKFHKHYVARISQITKISDLFKAAKEIGD